MLLKRPNPLKSKLHAGETCFGLWCSTASPMVAEVLGHSSFDYVIFDGEHGPNDVSSLLAQLHAFQLGKPEPVVRVPQNDIATFKRMSDIGFRSFLVPFVQNREQAEVAVQGIMYPPKGIRGLAPTRAAQFGYDASYVSQANDNVLLFVQIETMEAVGNVREILDVDGVDGVFVGPGDLSADIGAIGEGLNNPEVRDALRTVNKAAKSNGKLCGTIADESDLDFVLSSGCDFIAVGGDVGLLRKGTSDLWQFSKSLEKKQRTQKH